jgi:hypothetical protein
MTDPSCSNDPKTAFGLTENDMDVFKNLKVLVVDDTATNCMALEGLMRQVGCAHVSSSRLGMDGINVLRAEEMKGEPFDLLLLGNVLIFFSFFSNIRLYSIRLPHAAYGRSSSCPSRGSAAAEAAQDYLPKFQYRPQDLDEGAEYYFLHGETHSKAAAFVHDFSDGAGNRKC